MNTRKELIKDYEDYTIFALIAAVIRLSECPRCGEDGSA